MGAVVQSRTGHVYIRIPHNATSCMRLCVLSSRAERPTGSVLPMGFNGVNGIASYPTADSYLRFGVNLLADEPRIDLLSLGSKQGTRTMSEPSPIFNARFQEASI